MEVPMSTDDTRPAPADHQPPGDPKAAALLARVEAITAELDRLEPEVAAAAPEWRRRELAAWLRVIRVGVDELRADVEAWAAGL
jgi:hypothetical protein